MNGPQSQIDRLGEAIIEYANSTAQQLIEDAKARSSEILKSSDEQNAEKKKSFLAKDESAIRSECLKKISYYEFESYKKLLTHRNEIVEELFEDIAQRITNFADTEKYKELLLSSVRKADAEKKLSKTSIVFIKENDKKYAEMLKSEFGVALEIDKNIVYGGSIISYPEDGVIIDNTLDAAIEAERKRFVAHVELSV